jgi:hypothetical protein
MMGSWFDWGCWVSAGLLGVAALWMLWRGLLHEGRVRRGRRCPKCWYDLSASAAPTAESPVTCPECGRSVRREKDLHRTRRRMWLAVPAAAFVALGANLALVPARPDKGWTRWLPTTILIQLTGRFDVSKAPPVSSTQGILMTAAFKRVDSMWTWQRRGLLGPDLVPSARELRARVWAREKWPAGMPIRVHVREAARSIFAAVPSFELSAPDQVGGPYSYDVGGGCLWTTMVDPTIECSPRELGIAFFDVKIEAAGSIAPPVPPGTPGARLVGPAASIPQYTISGTWSRAQCPVKVEIVPTLDEAIAPVDDARLAELVRRNAHISLLPSERPGDGFQVWLALNTDQWPPDVAITCQVSLLRGSQTIAIFHDQGPPPPSNPAPRRYDTYCRSRPFADAVYQCVQSGSGSCEGWSLRIEGDGERALLHTDLPKYWSGSIEIPFRPKLDTFVTEWIRGMSRDSR